MMELSAPYDGYSVGEHSKPDPDAVVPQHSNENHQADNREDDHDVHPQEKQNEENASHPNKHIEDSHNRAVELHESGRASSPRLVQVCSDGIDLPRRKSLRQEPGHEFIDEKALRLQCVGEETTEKKLKDPVHESDDEDDHDIPLVLQQYLKNPSRPRFIRQQIDVYMLAGQTLHAPIAEKSGTQEQSSPQDYQSEMKRLGTYTGYPSDIPIFAIKLAGNGFIYRDECKAVECFFCKQRIPLSELNVHGADPAKMHRERSPTCSFVMGLNCTNVPFPRPEQFPQVAEASRAETSAVAAVDQSRNSVAFQAERKAPIAPTYQTDSVAVPQSPIVQQQSLQRSSSGGGATVADSVPSIQQPQASASTAKSRSHSGNGSPKQNLSASERSATASSTAENSRTTSSAAPRSSNNSSGSSQRSAQSNGSNASAAGTSNGKSNGAAGNGGGKVEPQKEKKKLTYSDLGIFAEKPKRADMAVLQKRLATFTGKWKHTHTQTPQMLADAGMYYAGYADCARCFFCGGGLKNWEPPDNPWIEHARWFPKCAYIRMCKGPKFVEIVQRKNKNKEDMTLREVEAEVEADAPKVDNGIDTARVPVTVSSSVGSEAQGMTAMVGATTDHNPNTGDLENLEEENEELKSQMACKICMDEDSSVVFLPCGHLVACTRCAIALKTCPLCRTDIKGSVRAHMI